MGKLFLLSALLFSKFVQLPPPLAPAPLLLLLPQIRHNRVTRSRPYVHNPVSSDAIVRLKNPTTIEVASLFTLNGEKKKKRRR